MSGTIPANDLVRVTPSVIGAGGRALDVVGVLLTTSARVAVGDVKQFANATDVEDFFGAGSDEAAKAAIYFNGFDNSNTKPAKVYFAQYPTAAVKAYLRGGDVSALSLNALKALTGEISLTIDGFLYDVTGIDLSSATSFSNAASLLQTDLRALNPANGSVTASIAGNVLTVSAVGSGGVYVGQQLSGSGVTAGTFVTGQLTGSAHGVGTYSLNQSMTVGSETITTAMAGGGPTVTYDSVQGCFVFTAANAGASSSMTFATGTGTIAPGLLLRSTDGGYLSQGASAATPGPFMDALVVTTQDWVTFCTLFDPDNSGNANKLLFAEWADASDDRYAYVCWDTDVTAKNTVPATSSLGYLLAQSDLSGTFLISAPDATKAAFACGVGASIDFTEQNGRITFKFRSQTGLTPDVTDQTTAANLRANGYNFYGVWATANQQFQGFADGVVSGPFEWFDSYICQVWLNSQLQLALINLLFQVKSIPYEESGYTLIRAACLDPINAALFFGAIRAGVTLSAAQIAEVNNAAGVRIDDVLSQVGWYLQILDASPQVRAARGSPPCTLWYMDGGSVQSIDLASIEVQ